MDSPKKLYDCHGGESYLCDTSFACEHNPSGVQETDTRTPIRTLTFRARIHQRLSQNPDSIHFELSFTPPHNTPSIKRTSSAHSPPTEDISLSCQKENVERNIALHSSPFSPLMGTLDDALTPSSYQSTHSLRVQSHERPTHDPTRKLSLRLSPRSKLTSPLIPASPLQILDFSCSDGSELVRFLC